MLHNRFNVPRKLPSRGQLVAVVTGVMLTLIFTLLPQFVTFACAGGSNCPCPGC